MKPARRPLPRPSAIYPLRSTMRRQPAGGAGLIFVAYAEAIATMIEVLPRDVGYPRRVAATFELAIEQAAERASEAEALVVYLAYCAPERIPMLLVEGAIENDMARLDALSALA